MKIYPWQLQQWQTLTQQYQQKRLPHALLLSGEAGLGKAKFAQLFAQYVLCENPAKTNDFCNNCRSCQLFKAGSHPDYFYIAPEDDSKVIKIDSIRQLTSQLYNTAQRHGFQVAILNAAEMMNRATANAFLKTLEEPPGNVLIILLNHRGSVLPTIMSRCQKISFSSSRQEMSNWLQTQISDESDFELLLRTAHYAPLQAMELSKKSYIALRDDMLATLIAILQNSTNPLEKAEQYAKSDSLLLIDIWINIVSDLSRISLTCADKFLINNDKIRDLERLNSYFSVNFPHHFLQKLLQIKQWLLNSNLNVVLLFEDLFLEWTQYAS